MWKTNLSTFDSWSFRWESTQELWFVLVEEDELPFLCLRSGVNQASVGKVPFTTMTERRSRAMGRASFNARFNITDVICAPSFTCFTAADNFIKGFQDGLEDEMKILNIKVDGGLSSTVEGYYLYKQFQSMLVESGFNVDESYETSVKCPENYKIDPYVNLDWRINTALGSIKKKYSGLIFRNISNVGMDFAGPLLIRGGGSKHRSKRAYICLFTCMVDELYTWNLSLTRRSRAFCVHCDAVRTGKLCSDIPHQNVSNGYSSRNVPPGAGGTGNVWCDQSSGERSSIDLRAKRDRGARQRGQEEMALTLAHFLIGRSLTAFPDRSNRASHGTLSSSLQHLLRRWSYQRKLEQPRFGDVVLVADHNAPRRRWPLGRIVELLTGSDGLARSAKVDCGRCFALIGSHSGPDGTSRSSLVGSAHQGDLEIFVVAHGLMSINCVCVYIYLWLCADSVNFGRGYWSNLTLVECACVFGTVAYC
ncbi:hypothetical protein T4D_6083 [Trichinella pseudospiralis]|uniref:DUF5641 domain-containing protein n=2 Tax=Trichinella TaxID=6333 RepID=A0A0V1F5F8_TRIPS|nr:hypothetical protein T4D_6083 [Trichinella pseudospiralis]